MTANTYKCNIYIGLKEGYDGIQHSISELYEFLQEYCNEVGLCVTVTPTKYIYRDGRENGAIIGLINYPRYPKTDIEIRQLTSDIAVELLDRFNQYRCTVEYPDSSFTLDNEKSP